MQRLVSTIGRWLPVFLLLGMAFSPAAEMMKSEQVARPPLPPIKKITVEPDSLILEDARDERRVLVWGHTKNGMRVDLTADAKLSAAGGVVEICEGGYIGPKQNGKARITVQAAGKQVKFSVTVKGVKMPVVRFVRDVMPIISKVRCNAGTCHGAAKGKNGFKLSLRGYDSEFDYRAFVNDISGRRINKVVPEKSLMLLKPVAAVPHEGHQLFKPGSRHYNTILQWVREGAKPEEQKSARAVRVEVLPNDAYLDLPGRSRELIVIAHYADGTNRDVTREAVITSNDTEVGKIVGSSVTAIRRGEAAILVRYEGSYATARLTVMGDRKGFSWKKRKQFNFIDEHVDNKLKKMRILPSKLASDEVFARRVYLDLTGLPPTAAQARAFLKSKASSQQKRSKLIQQLIGNIEYIEYWTNKWADMLQCNSATLGVKGVWSFRQWIRQSIASNKPYDRFAVELLTAQGSSYRNPAVNYFRSLRETGKITEDVSQTFLGIRFNCNKCHDHPFEKWTQSQYYEFGAYFTRVAFKKGTAAKEEIVYRKYNGKEMKHPKTQMTVAPRVPFGKADESGTDRRGWFVKWLTSAENSVFAKSYVNRTWSYFLGKGIIDPVDDIRASNPPSNSELLDALTADFVKSGFNVQHLVKTICESRTYQTSFVTNKWNEDDTMNFSHASPRRLSAEQLIDAVSIATGSQMQFPGVPKGFRSVQVPDGQVKGNSFLTLFGRPKRKSACECERTNNFTLGHAMNLVNGPTVANALKDGKNTINKYAAAEKNDRKVIEEIYYSCLSRPPTEKELKFIDLSVGKSREESAQDLAWALLNSPAFLFNR